MMMQTGGSQAKLEGSVQVGVNIENPMLARAKKQAEEYVKLFGTPQPQTFVSQRTKNGDLLIMRAHQAAKQAIKGICPEIKLGITLSLHDIQPQSGGEAQAEREWNDEFRHYLPYLRDDDFLGVQSYTRTLMGPDGSLPVPADAETTRMGYEFYPQALESVIRKAYAEIGIPIMVTENGVAAADDTRRVAYIENALDGVQSCLDEGIPVLGYCHWSLMDNFEWQKGYSMTFGLIAVDRTTQKRTAKPSLSYLGSYAAGKNLLSLMEMDDVSLLHGAADYISDREKVPVSEGSQFIIDEAMKDSDEPLYIALQAGLTDLAAAYLTEPRIAEKITAAVWIGGSAYPCGGRESNFQQDIYAAQVLFD